MLTLSAKPRYALIIAVMCVFSLCLCSLGRTLFIQTNDLFHFGRGGSWWCYTIVHFRNVSASLDIYDPSFHGGPLVPHGDLYFTHIKAVGGTWSVSHSEVTLVRSRDFYFTGYYEYAHAGRPAYVSYYLLLGPILPVLTVLTGIPTFLWFYRFRRERKRRRAGLCPACSYDLRAHAPGQACPECGTPILSLKPTPQTPPPSSRNPQGSSP